jgi:hypothetical protein
MGGVARVITGSSKAKDAVQAAAAPAPAPVAAEPAGRSEMAERTAASLRARRRGSNRNLLGGEEQSILG